MVSHCKGFAVCDCITRQALSRTDRGGIESRSAWKKIGIQQWISGRERVLGSGGKEILATALALRRFYLFSTLTKTSSDRCWIEGDNSCCCVEFPLMMSEKRTDGRQDMDGICRKGLKVRIHSVDI